ncbi:Esterase/Lipase [Mycena chlorophos]|uniref:Esterase/Lipase n=1 Tax=Mycena chlorophos TaxID=658473 RepID=A0A8H6SN04_MYCCL|nr:Esterase/Lipase [Mycena chlorophos]
MDFKQTKTQRGFTYSYHFAPAASGKPTFLFSHGFPTPAYVWRKQIVFFESLGFGIVAPDLLGYGGTDKPTDPKAYVGSGLAQDIVDLLDKEGVEKVIGVGHDWGSRVVSRIANYHPERLVGCAFLGVGYGPPASRYADPIAQSAQIKEAVGYDVLAYMQYFIEPDAHVLMEKNFDSFFSLLFPVPKSESQPEDVWLENMCAAGKAKEWIVANKTTGLPPYMTFEASRSDKEYYRKALSQEGGLCAPLCWYKVLVDNYNAEDDSKIPESAYVLNKPVLFIAFNKDPIGLPMFGMATHAAFVKPESNLTNKAVEGDHWAVMSHADELNKLLLEWTEGLKL